MKPATKKTSGLSLLKRGQKGLIHALFSRLGLFILLLALQVGFLFGVFRWFRDLLPHFLGGTVLFSACMVLYLINSRLDPTAKITWLIVIMLLPVFGALLFWFTQSEIGHRAVKARIDHLIDASADSLQQRPEVMQKLRQEAPGCANLAGYINRTGCHPVYRDTAVTYFPLGEAMWEELLEQLSRAKHFIFMEYFIVDEGDMWGLILEILARKAKEGVDVRVLYDGTNEFTNLPHDYPRRLQNLGIRCRMFAPVVPLMSTHYNYRDHRKITVIDGQVAFTGGVNLADEYINHIRRYGHWKDTAVMLRGEAVDNFTLMFLQMWNITEKETEFTRFLHLSQPVEARGYVLPFGDCPLDDDKVGERVYMDILNRATRSVSVMTPYLILDGELETALKFAAERGVSVKLILPAVNDNPAAFALAKTHYASLMDSGVEVYEYTPGFVHAKMFLADGREAVVGTINLDYRSLYHHFECGVWMYDTDCIGDIGADFDATLALCRRITPDTIWQGHKLLRPVGHLLKAIATLM